MGSREGREGAKACGKREHRPPSDSFIRTAEAGQAHTRNWPVDDYVEIFTLNRKDEVYSLTLGWAAGRLTDAAITSLRPAAAQPFGSAGIIQCRRRE